ncbi:DUF3618 domain-containing protein [Nonomuraea sp. NN258]|nr:DUF3618 domain-containing protein [Nonomuraea antri]
MPDDRTEATESRTVEEESVTGRAAARRDHGDSSHDGRPAPGRTASAHVRKGDVREEDDVRRSIEETRRELGDTVSALAAKADVKSRANDAAGTAKEKAADTVAAARDKAADAAALAKGKAAEVADKVRESTPEQVKDAATEARKRPVLVVAAVGTVVALVVRRLVRRNRSMIKTRPATRNQLVIKKRRK